MTVTAEPRLTAREWARVVSDPTKDRAYELTGLGTAVSDYLARRAITGLAARTLDQYERDIARLCILRPDKTAADITAHDLLDVLSTYPVPSRRRVRAAYRAFFGHLYADAIIPADPSQRVPAVRYQRDTIIDVFTGRELELLRHGPAALRDRAIVGLLIDTGIRKSEACRLRLADIDTSDQRLAVRRGKGGRSRVVPIPLHAAQLIEELATLDGLNPPDHVWYVRTVDPHGREHVTRDKPMGAGAFHRWWERMCVESGVRYRSAHVCRHTYATRLLKAGVGMASVSRLLGHASIRTTVDEYGHLSVEDLAAELERVLGG